MLPRALAVLLAVLALAMLTHCDMLHSDQIACEEAVSHVHGCCASTPISQLHCANTVTNTTPDISESQSTCLRAMSCGQLEAAGVCTQDLGVALRTVCPNAPVCNGIPKSGEVDRGGVMVRVDGQSLPDLVQSAAFKASQGERRDHRRGDQLYELQRVGHHDG